MRDEDPRRHSETRDLLSGMRLLREDLDALEALLVEDTEGEA